MIPFARARFRSRQNADPDADEHGDDVEISLDLLLPRDAVSVPATRRILDAALQTLGATSRSAGTSR
ncbi:hypothetical protein BJF79_37880 [Actinomadura sp. CNU-125]|nr:hypothetical protein BJF79_37880 [Actinomadura sp. CNU-125]